MNSSLLLSHPKIIFALIVFAVIFPVHVFATITGTGNNINAVEGASFNGVVANFTDTISTDAPSDFSATINWGDGTTLSVGTIVANGTGGFNVSGNHTYAEEAAYTITATLRDNRDNSTHVATPGTATVKDALLIAGASSSGNCTEGSLCNLTVAAFTDADPSGIVTDYTATINWGDGTPSSPGTIVSNVSGSFNISGSHVYAEEGNYIISTFVADSGGSTINMNTSVAVADAPLSASSAPSVNCTEGTACNLRIATFTDADSGGTASDYTATINWGDGSTTSVGTIVANVTGGFNVSGSHVYAEEGNFTASVTMLDVGGSTAIASTSVVVADAALAIFGTTVNATEGISMNAVMASFTDADAGGVASDYNAVVDWGDGTRSVATIVANGAGGFNVVGSHIYADEGNYNAQVAVADTGGSAVNANTNVVVSDAALSSLVTPPGTCTEGVPCNLTVANFSDANPSASASDYAATIHWGDGTSSVGTISGAPGNFSVSGSHAYSEEGSRIVATNVVDVGGSTILLSTTVLVADAALSASETTVVAGHGTPFTAVMATFTDADPNGIAGDYTAIIVWGDGTANSAGTITANGSGGFNVTGTHTYGGAGSHTATVTINDVGGSSAIATSTVKDDFPLTATGRRLHVRLGQPFSLVVAGFNDADPSPSIGNFSATIDWGDGSPTTQGIIASNGLGFNVIGNNHVYRKVGAWNITVTIQDSGGASAAVTGTVRLFPRAFSY